MHGGMSRTPPKPSVLPVQVRAGDIVLLGSDGLWDNLSNEQIIEQARVAGSCNKCDRWS